MQRIQWKLHLGVMLFFIMSIAYIVPSFAQSGSSENTITVSFQNSSIKDALKKIASLSGLQFVFADALLKNSPKVTGTYKNASIVKVLNAVLINNGFNYTQDGNNIIVGLSKSRPNAAKGKLSGIVTDYKTKEPLIGIMIKVGDQNVQTDIDGKFTIELPAKEYKVEMMYLGYKSITQQVILKEKEETVLTISMSEDASALNEVVVTQRRLTNTNIALVESIRDARAVVNGISKEQIARSQDRDAAEVMRRVAGVSVMQNRFIVIRGMGQRYNTVLLNNAIAPSFEPDSRAFSFDIIPSGMIDHIMVYKTAVPELPGDFAGGVVKVYTTGTPAANAFNVSYLASYRPSTTFHDFMGQADGKYAWAGYDDGTYKKPIDYALPQNSDFDFRMNATNKFNQNWTAINQGKALPDQRFNLDFARVIPVSDVVKFGITGGLSYSNTKQYLIQYRNPRGLGGGIRNTVTDELYNRDIRLSGLLNFSLDVGHNHHFSFKNLYTHLGSTRYLYRRGYAPYDDMNELGIFTGDNFEQFILSNDYRGIYSGQLNGNHELFGGKTKVNWLAAHTRSDFYAPDERRRTHNAAPGSVEWGPWVNNSFGLGTEGREQRVYWNVPENVKTLGLDIVQQINLSNQQFLLKAGFYYEDKNRSASFVSYAHIDAALVGGGDVGFNIYDAYSKLKAGYLAAEIPFLKRFKLYAGVRVEDNVQHLTTSSRDATGPNAGVIVVNLVKTSFLPSVNLSYNFTDKTLLRAAWSRTLNRPEFREISATQYYDMANNSYVYGNPQLLPQADIDNVDLRLEHYPAPGEMITLALFHKKIENPYELYSTVSTSGIAYIWQNSETARNYGAEIDVMLGLSRYFHGHSFVERQMQKTSLLFNAAYIYSRLDLGEAQRYEQLTNHRPLMGQSPYLINAGINYTDDSIGLKLNISYNIVGKRIATVGNRRLAAVWELPRHSLDFTISKRIFKTLEIRGGIQNILNSRIVLGQDMNGDGKFDIVNNDYELQSHKEHDNRFQSWYDSPYYTLGIALRL